jgi:iron complex outermembrane recepter protein
VNAKLRTAILLSCGAAGPVVAWAQVNPSDSGALQEIVITAQKRIERLTDVPVAATVLAPDALSRANAGDISDLNNLVPSVNMNATLNGRVPLGIRGVSSNANEGNVGLASGVAIMRDGVPIPSDAFSANRIEDVKAVEVLKGPQATLGGRTASAGVINFVTRGPSKEFTGSVSGTVTNDDEYRGNFYVAGPMSDTVAYSLSAYGGTVEYPITNIKSGEQTQQNSYGGRGKLQFTPSDELDVLVGFGYNKWKTKGFNFTYAHIDEGAHMLGIPAPFMARDYLNAGVTIGWENDQYISPVEDAGSDVKAWDTLLNMDYRVGNTTLSSTTAYLHEKATFIQDLFATDTYWWNVLTQHGQPDAPPPFFNFQELNYKTTQFSEEIKLASDTEGPFSYLIGAFYSDTKVRLSYVRDFLPAMVDVTVTAATKTTGIYGRTNWELHPGTSLVTGLRWNKDRIGYKFDQRMYVVAFPTAIYPGLFSEGDSSSDTLVGDISLQQKLGDAMVYATYARGYAPAVYDTAQALLPDGSGGAIEKEPVGETDIDHFEIGMKGLFLDRHLSLNVAAFMTTYKNYQIQFFRNTPGVPAPVLELQNAGKARTQGLEIDATYQTDTRFRLTAAAALINAKFKDYVNAPCWFGQIAVDPGCAPDGTGSFVQDVSGKRMPNSPKFKGSIGAEQGFDVGAGGYSVTVGAQYIYRDKAQMLPDQNPQAIMDSFGLLNAQVALHAPNDRWSVTLFGNNLTDEFYAGDVQDFWSGPWSANAVVQQPARDAKRYFGLRLDARF